SRRKEEAMTTGRARGSASDDVEHLAWMCGAWVEDREDRRCEEIWSSPDAGTLMGMFRWTSGDEVSFFEFMVVRAVDDRVEMHVKHFHPTLVSWEDREGFQEFFLAERHAAKAVFAARTPDRSSGASIIYRLDDPDRLTVSVIEAEGRTKVEFRFRRLGCGD
ncbi:MAG: DUF6265 family protein, partial [Candidatus Bipolaricaulota bacterium]